jgi:hypothetical protein
MLRRLVFVLRTYFWIVAKRLRGMFPSDVRALVRSVNKILKRKTWVSRKFHSVAPNLIVT